MPLQIVRNDITKMNCDAIVNAANNELAGGGGVDGAIHKAAGPKLLAECKKLGGCATGDAKLTRGCDLPSRYVIHTVGPVWQGGGSGEEALLRSCYRRSLEIAKRHRFKSVAFPLISAGVYGYPKDRALRVAADEIGKFLLEHDMLVYIVVYEGDMYGYASAMFADVSSYIDDNYVKEHAETRRRQVPHTSLWSKSFESAPAEPSIMPLSEMISPQQAASESVFEPIPEPNSKSRAKPELKSYGIASDMAKPSGLRRALDNIDESFAEMLLRKIDERGMKDSECYKKANVDRKLFSKIRSDKNYHPSKQTAIAFAVALELTLDETRDMLMKAGFALSHSSKFDIIIEYFITHGNYNIIEINEALFAFDQNLLGA